MELFLLQMVHESCFWELLVVDLLVALFVDGGFDFNVFLGRLFGFGFSFDVWLSIRKCKRGSYLFLLIHYIFRLRIQCIFRIPRCVIYSIKERLIN